MKLRRKHKRSVEIHVILLYLTWLMTVVTLQEIYMLILKVKGQTDLEFPHCNLKVCS